MIETLSVCTIEVSPPGQTRRRGEPLRVGVPFPRGWCRDAEALRLRRGLQPVPFQALPLDRWSDGSVRWALVDFKADAGDSPLTLQLSNDGPAAAQDSALVLQSKAGTRSVSTGRANFTFSTGPRPILVEWIDDLGAPRSGWVEPEIEVDSGIEPIAFTEWTVEHQGPRRIDLIGLGTLALGPQRRLEVFLRVAVFEHAPVLRLDCTIRNPHRADHPGGIWELGAASSVLARQFRIHVHCASLRGAQRAWVATEPDASLAEHRMPIELYQDSSGGEHWNGRVHVNREGRVPASFRGYRLRTADTESQGLRATPILVVGEERPCYAVSVPQFWENCPSAVEADTTGITVSFLPRQYGDLHELQGGEQRTFRLWATFGPDEISHQWLGWTTSPLVGHATPPWYSATSVIPGLTPRIADAHGEYLGLVDSAIQGEDSFFVKRERADEFGWRAFGDVNADHENAFTPDPRPIVSHYNNQYDAVAGSLYQFMRSGDLRWWVLARDMASHVVDIDIYHTNEDRAAYNQGLFWHTFHYRDAGKSTHRSYPRSPGVNGGGPSPEHNYGTGLLLSYYLTGDTRFREAVLGLAAWVVDMDDGRKSRWALLDSGPTGAASSTGSADYHGPGRGPANSIHALLNAFTLTGEARWLDKTDELIRRCIHPSDDLAARNLLDAERRWYYTVFLQALGRYLEFKTETEKPDAMYAYARDSLLHYARWMAEHEYPYLDQPDKLEYPTETWAAQDMRKSEVFDYAWLHADREADRIRYRERADFFFRSSVDTLGQWPTRTTARPVILMLSYGFRRAWYVAHPEARGMVPPTTAAHPLPVSFVPQRQRVVEKLKQLVVAGAGVALLAAAGLVWLWWR